VSSVNGEFSAKLENVVALALLRELHLLEDTAGSKVSLHYLRDKDKNEVDFLTVIDKKPSLMIEVKVSDESFSRSLFRFHKFIKSAKSVQLVYNLKRKKSTKLMSMYPVHEFLAEFELTS
jgi:predicted AAA+ superfamily ATPase